MRSYLRLTGEILVTCGIVVALFMAYMFWGTALRESQAQRAFASELGSQWASGADFAALGSLEHLRLGKPFALITAGLNTQVVAVPAGGVQPSTTCPLKPLSAVMVAMAVAFDPRLIVSVGGEKLKA